MPLDLKALSVLLVENIPEARELVSSVLDTLQVGEVYEAEDSNTAFDIFCETSPDIVITEGFAMPADGITLTRHIRTNMASPDPKVPIIITTGFASKEHIALARDVGATEYMVKPFSALDVAKRIAHVINKPSDFIKSSDFFGPDRRRRNDPDYAGPHRREDDPK